MNTFKWLLKRESWEHRGGFLWAPVVAGAVFLVISLMAIVAGESVRRGVDGDQGYSGLMTKNPIHTGWDATWLTDRLYSLPELDAHLTEAGDMPPPGWARTRRANPVGLGRNCDIFETARHWAYRRVRDCPDRTPASAEHLRRLIAAEVSALNATYTEPLPASEAAAIVASIHRWITTKSRMWADGAVAYEATLITKRVAKGRRGGLARGQARRQGLELL